MNCSSVKLSECNIATNFYSWIFDIFCTRHFENVSGWFESCNPNFSLLSFSSLRFTQKLERVCCGMFRMVLVSCFQIPSRGRNPCSFNTLGPRQHGRHFTDDTFKRIFLNENLWISIKISLKFVPKCPIDNIPALLQIMAWRRPGDKPLSEAMTVSLLTHICVARPQWVNIETL